MPVFIDYRECVLECKRQDPETIPAFGFPGTRLSFRTIRTFREYVMELITKACLGAVAVVAIQLLSRSRSYFLAGLIPLFPTFTLICHYIVGTERRTAELKQTILFGMFALIPYLIYMIALYFLVDRLKLVPSLAAATAVWFAAAIGLVMVWKACV